MLELTNTEKRIAFVLSIDGYEFPNDPKDNWCLVSARLTQDENQFTVTDPALEAPELQSILEWFECLSERKLPSFASLSFTEPCLEFEFLACNAESVRISVNLSYEMTPTFIPLQFGEELDELDEFDSLEGCDVIFDLTPHDFESITKTIKAAMKQYPVRS